MINTTLCYIEKDNKYLMLLRNKKKNDLNAQKWIGVGGKFIEGETPSECLIREIKEETGLTLTAYEYVGLIKFVSDTWEDEDMYLFKGTDFEGELTDNCPEGTLKWVPSDEVLDLPTWEGDKYFLTPLIEGKRNLNMTVCYEGDKLASFSDDTCEVVIDQSSIISSPHGFSTRIGGVSEAEYATLNLGMNRGDYPGRVTENWRRFFEKVGISSKSDYPFVCGKQVHGNNVHIATMEDARPAYGPGELIEADGYITNVPNLPLAIFTADCVPLLMEDPVSKVVAAIHCGWRSTVADIEGVAISKMKSLCSSQNPFDPSNIHAAIGPAIDQCCYEVGEEVIEAVKKLLFERNREKEASQEYPLCLEDKPALWFLKDNGKYMLDLRGVVKTRLLQLGLKEENISLVGECTMCHPEKYYSHRYSNGARGSLACVIMLPSFE